LMKYILKQMPSLVKSLFGKKYSPLTLLLIFNGIN